MCNKNVYTIFLVLDQFYPPFQGLFLFPYPWPYKKFFFKLKVALLFRFEFFPRLLKGEKVF